MMFTFREGGMLQSDHYLSFEQVREIPIPTQTEKFIFSSCTFV